MISIYLSLLEDQSDADLFEKVYYEHKERVLSIVFGITQDIHLAEDALQNTFFAIARNFKKIDFSEPKMLKVYIYKIAKNAAIDVLKAEKKEKFEDLSLFENYVSAENEYKNIEDREIIEKIKKCIIEVPDRYRDVLSLHYLFDFSAREISDMLNIPPSTVHTKIQRGKKLLKKAAGGEEYVHKK